MKVHDYEPVVSCIAGITLHHGIVFWFVSRYTMSPSPLIAVRRNRRVQADPSPGWNWAMKTRNWHGWWPYLFFNVTFRMSPGKKQPDAFAITTLNSPLWTFQEGFQVGTALKWPQAFLQFSKPFAKTHQPYQSFLHTMNPFWVWIGATRILSMISFFPHSISWASVSRFGFNKFVQEVLPV